MKKEQKQTSRPAPNSILPQIDTIVYVMFENRSLDNLLGWLYDNDKPLNMVPPIPGGPQYDGLQEGVYSLPLKPHFWSHVTNYPIKKGTGDDGFTTPNLDPNEGYPNVLNQLFGDAENSVKTEPPNGTRAAMQGFLQDFDSDLDTWDETLQITETYTNDQVPVLSGLAKQYAVSDRWYCSMPTQTNPNRAFSLCGTSLGRLINSGPLGIGIEQFKTKTIWNALAQKNVSMGIYYSELWHDKQCYTQYTFPYLNQVSSSLLEIEEIDDPKKGFYARAAAGTLPAFTYIEPKWGGGYSYHLSKQGSDYHPPTDIRPGELLLFHIYNALKSNKQAWSKTLLIVTFDEHGGTYDHVAPPWGATNPGDPQSESSDFNFNLFGVRVPTLLISPYIPKSTVFRTAPGAGQYDHTSILATLLKWKGIDPENAGLLNRVAVAPTFENVLGNTIVNEGAQIEAPNTEDCFKTEANRILEQVPAPVARHIAEHISSLEGLKRVVEDYLENHPDY